MSVENNLQKISFEEARVKASAYKYALVYQISKKIFTETASIDKIDWDELVEAYFFDKNGQLHIYQGEDEMEAVVYTEGSETKYVDQRYAIKEVGSKVIVREYLQSDEDGQIYVAYTRLFDIEGGAK